MPAATPRIFNIPAAAPFLPTLFAALIDGALVPGFPASRDPLALAAATIYLPTRRACRLARDVFLDAVKGEAAILPRIVAIGDLDEDELIFADAAAGPLAAAAIELKPALSALERRLLLAELIIKWANAPALRGAGGTPLVANTPTAALGLADDLTRLLDDMITRKVDWARLDGLVPGDLDRYWQLSLDFLKIARAQWPALLAERGVIEPAERRDRLIEAEAARLARSDGPVIAAGSTGSMPATAALLAAIAALPHGAVVLPGLDTDLDDTAWQSIAGTDGAKPHDGGTPAAGHPQFAMQALLARIGITREAVVSLVAPDPRAAFLSEALRPAAATERWQQRRQSNHQQRSFDAMANAACDSITVIEAATLEDEALAIAVALRETIETADKTAALVTADRALARRVLAALERWDVDVEDSGGNRLADTPAGIFAQLAAEAALGGLAPVTLLALLKHPLLRLGRNASGWSRAVAALERVVLRGPRPRPGVAALRHALAEFRSHLGQHRRKEPTTIHASDPRLLVADADLDAATDFVDRLAAALAPLEAASDGHTVAALAGCHRDIIAVLSTGAGGEAAVFAGSDGRLLELALDELIGNETAAGLAVSRTDYPDLFHEIIGGRVVRRQERRGIRVRIFGPLEARLQNADRVVLGGLNEGSWPPEIRNDPWLSRPMRHKLGLDLPERRIGLAAHDFAQGLGAPDVMLTRAAKVGGAPTVTSRFVQRLAALAGETRWRQAVERGNRYLRWAHDLDRPTAVQPIARPAPTPPVESRPATLSVTDVEDWLRDPYTIYARRVLKLRPLDAVDLLPGAADRGSVIHAAIGEFTQTFAAALPVDPLKELLAIGERHFVPLADFPEARAFWWPRFQRIAQWFVLWERTRRTDLTVVHGEISGRLPIPVGGRTFTLSARADRIEQRKDGSYAIVDYKTGTHRTEKQVRAGLAPQLTLEAAMLRAGAFDGVPAGLVGEILYVTLKGGEPAGKDHPINFKDGTPDSQAEHALGRLTGLVAKFGDRATPYYSLVHPMWATHYGDYDHLARVKEWSASDGREGSE